MRTESLYSRAAKAALRAAESAARNNPGRTIERVAVKADEGCSFDICGRAFYEEACSESEFICQAIAICENGKVSSDIET